MMRTIATMFFAVSVTACTQATTSEAPSSPAASKPAASKPAAAASKPAAAMAAETGLPAAPERGDDADRKSKNGALDAEIAGVKIRVNYGRPQVNGRTIFGDLIPYGKVWRTGADEATTISFSKAATFAGQKVERGTYALFTVPGESGWKVILNSQAKQWGAYRHDTSKDVLTADVTAAAHDNTEALTFAAADGGIQMMWADVAVTFPVASAQ